MASCLIFSLRFPKADVQRAPFSTRVLMNPRIQRKRYEIRDHVEEDIRCYAGATRNRVVERRETEAIARNVPERCRTSDQEPPRMYMHVDI